MSGRSAMTQGAPQVASGSVVLRGGTVLTIDTTHRVLPDTDVLVTGDRIAEVGPRLQVPEGTREIDASAELASGGPGGRGRPARAVCEAARELGVPATTHVGVWGGRTTRASGCPPRPASSTSRPPSSTPRPCRPPPTSASPPPAARSRRR